MKKKITPRYRPRGRTTVIINEVNKRPLDEKIANWATIVATIFVGISLWQFNIQMKSSDEQAKNESDDRSDQIKLLSEQIDENKKQFLKRLQYDSLEFQKSLALLDLQIEQQRKNVILSDEISKPNIVLDFSNCDWDSGGEFHRLEFAIVNIGQRTAKNLTLKMYLFGDRSRVSHFSFSDNRRYLANGFKDVGDFEKDSKKMFSVNIIKGYTDWVVLVKFSFFDEYSKTVKTQFLYLRSEKGRPELYPLEEDLKKLVSPESEDFKNGGFKYPLFISELPYFRS